MRVRRPDIRARQEYDAFRERRRERLYPRIGPPPVTVELGAPLHRYWLDRVIQHPQDSYAGIGFAKFPEDLRAYEHILWAHPPEVVIEIGTFMGASALGLRDRLRTLRAYGRISAGKVISIDLDIEQASTLLAQVDPEFEQSITLISGDVCDPELPDKVAR